MTRALPLALALWALPASAQLFSPGDLAKGHARLEGLKNCTRCHSAGEKLSAANCLGCHTELAPRIERGVGFHGRLGEEQKRTCEECHHEHQGRDFALIDFGPSGRNGFAHAKTGWPLEGKHRPLACNACHQPRLIEDGPLRELLATHPGRSTLLGAPSACSGCHFDEHRGQLAGACQTCHDARGFKAAPGFDHDRTRYPLEGKHEKVACGGCHAKETDAATPANAFPAPVSETFLRFKPVEHRACISCHDDPHEGRFPGTCESCHTVQGWRQIRAGGAKDDRAFHDETRYPLEGAHRDVQCRSCHGPFPGRPAVFKGLPFKGCTSCHADAHLGQLLQGTRSAAVAPCESCHAVAGFLPARFGPEQHAKTDYPLEGSHLAVACSACHPEDAQLRSRVAASLAQRLKAWRRPLRISLARFELGRKADRCEGCHEDPHGGQFEAKEPGCVACHSEAAFSKLRFDHDRDSRFPLTGAHASAACASCHTPSTGRGKDATLAKGAVRYRPLPVTCQGCHEDPHAGQLSGAKRACDSCHDTGRFAPASGFDHARTRFALEGKHAVTACNACHPAVPVEGGPAIRRYRPLPLTCEGCHADFHKGELQGLAP